MSDPIEVRAALEGRMVTILKASRVDADVGQSELAGSTKGPLLIR